jgi:hypothetical protein
MFLRYEVANDKGNLGRQPQILDSRKENKTHLINHVSQQTLHLVTLHRLFTPQTNRSTEFRDRNSGSPHRRCGGVFGFLEPAYDEHFPEKIA